MKYIVGGVSLESEAGPRDDKGKKSGYGLTRIIFRLIQYDDGTNFRTNFW